ncbi:MAG: hypothetical protein K0S32_1450 [Bacteroidetes bacterium]|jgi:hypothetical protein|nr:hypothetical protein [Bacteroidota bacterium]
MIKRIFFVLFLCTLAIGVDAQTKKGGKNPKGKTTAPVDSTANQPEEELDPMAKLELTLPLEMEIDAMTGKKVYYKDRKRSNDSLRNLLRMEIKRKTATFNVSTKYPKKGSKERIQLCINLANKDTNLVYCVNDSVLRDPEVSKLLFEQTKGDTTFALVYVESFSKSRNDGGLCNSGKEIKLFFARWNIKENRAKWKQKTITSCTKGITNMTKEPIVNWDKSAPLVVSYHRGSTFYDIKFDPQKPELGIQSGNNAAADEGK